MPVQRSSVGKGVISLDSILFVTLPIKKLNYSLPGKLCMFDYPEVACLLATILVHALYGNTSFFLYKQYPWYPVNASTVNVLLTDDALLCHTVTTQVTPDRKPEQQVQHRRKSVFNSILCVIRGLLSSVEAASSRKGNVRSGWLIFNEKSQLLSGSYLAKSWVWGAGLRRTPLQGLTLFLGIMLMRN